VQGGQTERAKARNTRSLVLDGLSGLQHPSVLVFAIELRDGPVFLPTEVNTSDELAVVVIDTLLQLRRGQSLLMQANPTDRFTRALASWIKQCHSASRLPGSRPPRHVGKVLLQHGAYQPERQGSVPGGHGLLDGQVLVSRRSSTSHWAAVEGALRVTLPHVAVVGANAKYR
jgi:hypothetical protein